MALLKQPRKKLLLQKLKLLQSQPLRRRLNSLQFAGYVKYLLCEIIKAAFAAFFISCFCLNRVHGQTYRRCH
jgi:hypothetical protein